MSLAFQNRHLNGAHSISGIKLPCKNHSDKKRKDILDTQAKLAILQSYVENQAILEPILLYWTSKCKQTKEQGNEDYLWTHIFTFL